MYQALQGVFFPQDQASWRPPYIAFLGNPVTRAGPPPAGNTYAKGGAENCEFAAGPDGHFHAVCASHGALYPGAGTALGGFHPACAHAGLMRRLPCCGVSPASRRALTLASCFACPAVACRQHPGVMAMRHWAGVAIHRFRKMRICRCALRALQPPAPYFVFPCCMWHAPLPSQVVTPRTTWSPCGLAQPPRCAGSLLALCPTSAPLSPPRSTRASRATPRPSGTLSPGEPAAWHCTALRGPRSTTPRVRQAPERTDRIGTEHRWCGAGQVHLALPAYYSGATCPRRP